MSTQVQNPEAGAAPGQNAAPYVNPVLAKPRPEQLLFKELEPELQEKFRASPAWRGYEDIDQWYDGLPSDAVRNAAIQNVEHSTGYSKEAHETQLAANIDATEDAAWDEVTAEDPLDGLKLIPASAFELEQTYWLYDGYIPLGEITLLAGREGIGKSSVALDIGAKVTRGTLGGQFYGKCRWTDGATQDSWSTHDTPRLMRLMPT